MPSEEPVDNSVKQNTLDYTIDKITQRYGTEAIKRASEVNSPNKDCIPTGSLSLNLAIGVGGVPRGRVTEIYGPASSGKTTLALSILIEAQRMGGTTAFIDMERVLHLPYASRLGVDLNKLLFASPETGEQAFEIMEGLIRTGEVNLIVLDSIAALISRGEIEDEMGMDVGDKTSRLIDQAMRKLSGPIAKSNTCVIFTDQLRIRPEVMFGNPETPTGGVSLANWASIRLDIRRIQQIKVGQDIVGSRTRVRVVKNRLNSPFKTAEFDIIFDKGISRQGELLDLARMHEIITREGAFYLYGKTSLGQGRMNAVAILQQNEKIANEIENKIRQEFARPEDKNK